MTNKKLLFVSFKYDGKGYTSYIPLSQFLADGKDVETTLKEVAKAYQDFIRLMKKTLAEIQDYRSVRKTVPARLIWTLGDLIFQLTADLESKGFQIDGIYEHLVRDLEVKRKWLEKVILRRYVPNQGMIPEKLNWGYYEKSTRRKAEGTSKGVIPR